MKRTLTIRVLAVLFAVLLVLPVAGCTPEDKALAMDFITSYFTSKVDPTQNGIEGLGNLWGAVTGRGGDPEVNAALQAKQVIDDITETETLAEEAEEAWQNGDGETAEDKLEEAIERRPDDVAYRIQLSALRAEMGDIDGAAEVVSGDGMDLEHVKRSGLVIADYSIRYYERALHSLAGTDGGTPEQRGFLGFKLYLSWSAIQMELLAAGYEGDAYRAGDKATYYRDLWESTGWMS